MDRLLSQNEVLNLTGLCRKSLYNKRRSGDFPPARKIFANKLGWLESDIRNWMANLPLVS